MTFSKALWFDRFIYSFLFIVSILFFTQNVSAGSIDNSNNQLASTISGIVFDQNRTAIPEVDVELMNEISVVINRTRTDSLGRYEFNGLTDGRYYVKVLPFRYNLKEKTEEVVIQTLSLLGPGSGYFTQDFYLSAKKGALGDTVTGVVYVQETPEEAERFFKKAVDSIREERSAEAIDNLQKAIELFPTYYAATQLLGIELLKSQRYLEAARFFIRAAEINPKSSRSFYYMGFSLNKVGKKYNKAALKALDKAIVLAPASWEVAYLVGKIQREEGNFADAEKHLLKSKKLTDTKRPEIHIELAQLYGNDLKQYGKAADELELYLKASKKKNDEKTKKQIENLRQKARQNS